MKQYFIQKNKKQTGPYSFEELKNEKINKNTLIWYEGLKKWEKAINLKELDEILKTTTIISSNKNVTPPKIKKSKKKLIFIILGIILFIVVAFFSYVYISENNAATAINNDKEFYRNNWKTYVKYDVGYSYYNIGGIEDIKVTVTNNMPYEIDYIKINLVYMKKNGTVYDRKSVKIKNIAPFDTKYIYGDNSTRGVSLDYSIKSITSSEISLYYSE